MISKTCKFLSDLINRLSPVKLKTWFYDEFLPLFVVSVFALFQSAFFYQPLLLTYTCWKWRGWIWFALGYQLWIQYDSKILKTAGRKIPWITRLGIFKYLQRYCPLRLIKVADLPPDKNYILGCYPHGVLPYGAYSNFCTSANNVEDLFPNIDIRAVTGSVFFYFFLAREFLMATGMCSADKENLIHFLNSTPSKALAIFPGGLQDLFYSRPGNVYTITTNRKGFIQIALETGSALVPVFSFGEQNVMDRKLLTGSRWIAFNKLFRKLTRGEVFLLKGRGGTGSPLPYRRPVTTVVGKPIDVPKVENPTAELVDEYHERFFKALHSLFEEYKSKFDEAGGAAQLIMK